MMLKVPKHIKKWLENNNCWDEWVSNVIAAIEDENMYIYDPDITTKTYRLAHAQSEIDNNEPLFDIFNWVMTKEGHEFWRDKRDKFLKYKKEYETYHTKRAL